MPNVYASYLGKTEDGTRIYSMFPAEPAGLTFDEHDLIKEYHSYLISCCDQPGEGEEGSPCLEPEASVLVVPRDPSNFDDWAGEEWVCPTTPPFGSFKLTDEGIGDDDVKAWFCKRYWWSMGTYCDSPLEIEFTTDGATGGGANEGWMSREDFSSTEGETILYEEDVLYRPPELSSDQFFDVINAPIPGTGEYDKPWLPDPPMIGEALKDQGYVWYQEYQVEGVEPPLLPQAYIISNTTDIQLDSGDWEEAENEGWYYQDISYTLIPGYSIVLAYLMDGVTVTTERVDGIVTQIISDSVVRILYQNNEESLSIVIHVSSRTDSLAETIYIVNNDDLKAYPITKDNSQSGMLVVSHFGQQAAWEDSWVLDLKDLGRYYLQGEANSKAGMPGALKFRSLNNPFTTYTRKWDEWWSHNYRYIDGDNEEEEGPIEPLVKCRKEGDEFIADTYASPAYYVNAISTYKLGVNPAPTHYYTSNGVPVNGSDGTPVPYKEDKIDATVYKWTMGGYWEQNRTVYEVEPELGRFRISGTTPRYREDDESDKFEIEFERTEESKSLDVKPRFTHSGKEITWESDDGGEFPTQRKGYPIYEIDTRTGDEEEDVDAIMLRLFHRDDIGSHGWITRRHAYPMVYYHNGSATWKFTDGYHVWIFDDFVSVENDDGAGGLYFDYEENKDDYGNAEHDFVELQCDTCCCMGCCDCDETEFQQNMYGNYDMQQEYVNFFPDFDDYPSSQGPSIADKFSPKTIGLHLLCRTRDSGDNLIQTTTYGELKSSSGCAFYGEWLSTGDKFAVAALVIREGEKWKYKMRIGSKSGDADGYFESASSGGTLYEGDIAGLSKFGMDFFTCAMGAPHASHVCKEGAMPQDSSQEGQFIDFCMGNPDTVSNSNVLEREGGGGFHDGTPCCPETSTPNPYPWLKPMTGRNTEVPGLYMTEDGIVPGVTAMGGATGVRGATGIGGTKILPDPGDATTHYCSCALIKFTGSIKDEENYELLGRSFWADVTLEDGAIKYEIKLCGDTSYIEGYIKLWPAEPEDASRSYTREIVPFYEGTFGSGYEWFRSSQYIKQFEVYLKEHNRYEGHSIQSLCDCDYSDRNSYILGITDPTYITNGSQIGEHPGAYDTEDVEGNLWFGDSMSVSVRTIYRVSISVKPWYHESEDYYKGPVWSTVGVFGEGSYTFEYDGAMGDDVDIVIRAGGTEANLGTGSATLTVPSGEGLIMARSNKLVEAPPPPEGEEREENYYEETSGNYFIHKTGEGPKEDNVKEIYGHDRTLDFELVHPCGMATLGLRDPEETTCQAEEAHQPTLDWPEEYFEPGLPFENVFVQYSTPMRIRLEDPDPVSAKSFPRIWSSLLNKDIYLDPEIKEDPDGFVYFIYSKADIDVGGYFTYTIQLGGVLEIEDIVYPRGEIHVDWGLYDDVSYVDPEEYFYGWGPSPVKFGDLSLGRIGLMRDPSSIHIQGFKGGELSFYSYGTVETADTMYFARRFSDDLTQWSVSVDNAMVLDVTPGFTILYSHPGTFG